MSRYRCGVGRCDTDGTWVRLLVILLAIPLLLRRRVTSIHVICHLKGGGRLFGPLVKPSDWEFPFWEWSVFGCGAQNFGGFNTYPPRRIRHPPPHSPRWQLPPSRVDPTYPQKITNELIFCYVFQIVRFKKALCRRVSKNARSARGNVLPQK